MAGVFRRPHHHRRTARFVPSGVAAAPTVSVPGVHRWPHAAQRARVAVHMRRHLQPRRLVVQTGVAQPVSKVPWNVARIVGERNRKILRERKARKQKAIVYSLPPTPSVGMVIFGAHPRPVLAKPAWGQPRRAPTIRTTPAPTLGMTVRRPAIRLYQLQRAPPNRVQRSVVFGGGFHPVVKRVAYRPLPRAAPPPRQPRPVRKIAVFGVTAQVVGPITIFRYANRIPLAPSARMPSRLPFVVFGQAAAPPAGMTIRTARQPQRPAVRFARAQQRIAIHGVASAPSVGSPVVLTPRAWLSRVRRHYRPRIAIRFIGVTQPEAPASPVVNFTNWSSAVILNPGDEWWVEATGESADNPELRITLEFDEML